jgi:hypothetical protein
MVLPVIIYRDPNFNAESFLNEITDLRFKVMVAEAFRNLQQKITESAEESIRFGRSLPLNLRVLIKVINRTAR